MEEGNGTAISISFPKISVEQTSSLQLILKEHLNGKEKFQLDSSRNNKLQEKTKQRKNTQHLCVINFLELILCQVATLRSHLNVSKNSLILHSS